MRTWIARHDTCLIAGGGSTDRENGNEQHDEYVSKTQRTKKVP